MKLAIKYNQKSVFNAIAGIVMSLSIIFFIIDEEVPHEDYWIGGLALIVIGLIILLIAPRLKGKLWILDRASQNIATPLILKRKPIVKSIYDTKSGSRSSILASGIISLVLYDSEKAFARYIYSSRLPTWWSNSEHISAYDTSRTWSFFIWYLDKNRPLPPGDILDPFREEDFLRRKAEGFPPPLFCSCVLTPEATPQQQAERDKYWKDEDYIFRLERYLKPLLWRSPKDGETTPLRLESSAVIVENNNNPNGWERKPYPEFKNFRYLPTAYAMRYQYEDGRIFYTLIDQKTEQVYTPPINDSCRREIIR